VWFSVGGVIATILMVNAVRDYLFVSRLLATQQVRHQMSQLAAQVEQYLRGHEVTPGTLERAMAGSSPYAESINLRNSEGVLLEHVGISFPTSAFTTEEEHSAFSRREQIFRTVSTASGELVVEVFPLHPGRRLAASPFVSGPTSPRPLLLELAMPLRDADRAVLTPIRRNLVINLAAALSLIATVLLAALGLRSYVRGRQLEEQMEIAEQVQSRLLPGTSLDLPGLQIAMEYKASEQIGGDFYDAFSNSKDEIALLIGDVSGKGIPAALLMGVIHGAVRTASWQSTALSHEAESIKLNRLLCDRASENRFASMFWCVYEASRRSLRYVNAGHCPPFLIGEREGKLITSRLERGGPVLGLLPDALYEATTVEVSPGDLLVMYSDGVVEANDAKGEEYGEKRLKVLLEKHYHQAPACVREHLMRSLDTFVLTATAQDDLTFAVIRL
jgi:sigma-B regulation protein RsbU (phosphoserine phosphatase)